MEKNNDIKSDKEKNNTQENTVGYSDDFSTDDDFSEILDNIKEEPVENTDKNDDEPNIAGDEYTYISRKEKKNVSSKKHSSKKFKPFFVIIPAVFLALILGVFLSLPFFLPKDAIASNVWSGNINLSKLTLSRAEEVLADSYIPKKTDFSVCFTHDGKTETAAFSSEEIELTLNPEKTAEEAYNIGRSDNVFKNSWDVLRSFFTPIDIGMIPACNEEILSEIFYELGASIYGQSEDVKCVIENNTLTITPPTPGQSHDVSEAIDEFLSSVRIGIYKDIPITLKSNESDKLDADELYEKLSAEPKNAEYQISNNQVTITDHVVGVEIDKAKFRALVDQVNKGIEGSIEVVETLPEFTKEALQNSLFGTTLASFSSDYASSSANRAYNVELAANKINGIVLADGDEFSYNSIVGNANAANGFKMATVFSEGKVTEGVGGGVCQVSSTLYCAVLRADLNVTERHNHSLPIGYVPGGQDATVSYGSLDFKFKNNTGAPIKIVTSYTNRKLTVSILGNESAKKKVDVVSEKISTIQPTMTEVKDPSLPAGQTKVISKGKSGSVYMTYKRVYANDGTLISETKTKSTYRATPGEISVGTAAVQTDTHSQTSTPASAQMPDSSSNTIQTPETPQPTVPEVSDTSSGTANAANSENQPSLSDNNE